MDLSKYPSLEAEYPELVGMDGDAAIAHIDTLVVALTDSIKGRVKELRNAQRAVRMAAQWKDRSAMRKPAPLPPGTTVTPAPEHVTADWAIRTGLPPEMWPARWPFEAPDEPHLSGVKAAMQAGDYDEASRIYYLWADEQQEMDAQPDE